MGIGTIVFIFIFGLAIILALSVNRSSAPDLASSQNFESNSLKTKRDEAAALSDCKSRIQIRKENFDKLMAVGKFWEAARTIGNCHILLSDSTLKNMVSLAEQKAHVQIANDSKRSARDRADALEMLARDYPERAKEFEKLRIQMQAKAAQSELAAQHKIKAAETARRRAEGVSIGMSKDDVIQSSWGRPRTINTTTYSLGTHEQWVYDGGYLYFENGVLTTIQN